MGKILYPLEYAVAWIMVHFHGLLTAIGLPSASGWTWALSIVGLMMVPTEFIPASDDSFTQLNVELPPGARLEDTAAVSAAAGREAHGQFACGGRKTVSASMRRSHVR